MRTVLICHAEDAFDRDGLAGWLGSFSDLAGIVVLEETAAQKRARVRREFKRSGVLGLADVAAMRAYYRLRLAAADRHWMEQTLGEMRARFGAAPREREFVAVSANSAAVAKYLRELAPDLVLARSKQLLKRKIFDIPRAGCWVMHPGICPEYRNAHGCFWALAQRDTQKVGLTLLRIDEGIDTGPVFGYYSYPYDECTESHVRIQHRIVTENLDALARRLLEIAAGDAQPIDTGDRKGGLWGQPRLSAYLRWKQATRRPA